MELKLRSEYAIYILRIFVALIEKNNPLYIVSIDNSTPLDYLAKPFYIFCFI